MIVGCYYGVAMTSIMLVVSIMGLDYYFYYHASACIKVKTFFKG